MSGRRSTWGTVTVLAFGYAFLYVPIALLVIYSFNESKLVTVWSGFSVKWYGELIHNEQLLSAAWLSLRIAFVAATGATILGTMAAYVLDRFKRFHGRTLMTGMIAAPLVMPEVITGLAMLLLFVALEQLVGWPAGRGVTTIGIAHTTFATAYVAIVVGARLKQIDRSLEEAALDLGARPWMVFFAITLPIIGPSLAAGWLLSFTLSLDDLVIASFVSGPGSSTLPMVIFSSVRLGVSPQINALATVFVVTVAVIVFVAGRLLTRRDRPALPNRA